MIESPDGPRKLKLTWTVERIGGEEQTIVARDKKEGEILSIHLHGKKYPDGLYVEDLLGSYEPIGPRLMYELVREIHGLLEDEGYNKVYAHITNSVLAEALRRAGAAIDDTDNYVDSAGIHYPLHIISKEQLAHMESYLKRIAGF